MNYLERLKKLEAEMAAPVAGTPVRWLEAVRAIITELEKQERVFVVCADAPSPTGATFVEVENTDGYSISVGNWTEGSDGYWRLGPLYPALPLPSISRQALLIALNDAEESSPNGEDSCVVVQKALESLGIKVTP